MTQTPTRRNRPGRPRHIPSDSGTMAASDQVLDAATELFVTQGFAATSTREIADKVGIRQASLYYHFAGKDELLEAALAKTVRPTLEAVSLIERGAIDPVTSVYVLALLDVQTLARAPHNSGLLGLAPDVAKAVPTFARERAQLAGEYGRLSAVFTPAPIVKVFGKRWGYQLLQQVEMVIPWIDEGDFDGRAPDAIASAVLRVCAVDETGIRAAKAAAHELLPDLTAELDLLPDLTWER